MLDQGDYRDPLVLDLDGDGIETINSSAGVVFDFNGDGTKTGTGWVAKDDGLLVFDRNNNGKIDNGTELFGDQTIKSNGGIATEGFDALRDLDTNYDGIFDSKDKDFNNVKVWQDINQDGIAQGEELKTLTEHGIAGIILDSHYSGKNNNGNTIVYEGSFIKEDGSIGIAGSLDFSSNPFFREHEDIEATEETKYLPNMHGSGAVYDLRAAATLNENFAEILKSYADLTTHEEQIYALDDLVKAWADNVIDFKNYEQEVAENTSYSFAYSWELLGTEPTEAQLKQKSIFEKLKVLESFNGRNFFTFENSDVEGCLIVNRGNTGAFTIKLMELNGAYYLTEQQLNIFNSGQLTLLNSAYEKLLQSVYQGLLLQTRLKDYANVIEVTSLSETKVVCDFTAVIEKLNTLATVDPVSAIIDVYDLIN